MNACSGWTEVGSLFLRPERRRGGSGSLLAAARSLGEVVADAPSALIAADSVGGLRAVRAPLAEQDRARARIDPAVAEALRLSEGEAVRVRA